ncbi:response regulator transcription factor [Dehalogenimonas sp. 4OHTPN]|uniref:Response regulator transcription factor n=1 Tax=Dehalogenimonas sp. 4OHTPN TaxID=3166643 RepID=A0AAU8GB58_9CHLR
MGNKILIVDDDPIIVKFLRANLKAEGFDVLTASDGCQAIELTEKDMPDLVILDIMMPNMDGYEVIRSLRSWTQVPILVLSARGGMNDKVTCLNLGADDYLTKPFSVEELTARVHAVLRRFKAFNFSSALPVSTPQFFLDPSTRRVLFEGKEIRLTPTEYLLLRELLLSPDKVLTQAVLLRKIWGSEYINDRQYLHVFIGRLRSKIEKDPAHPKIIETVSGVGYLYRTSGS